MSPSGDDRPVIESHWGSYQMNHVLGPPWSRLEFIVDHLLAVSGVPQCALTRKDVVPSFINPMVRAFIASVATAGLSRAMPDRRSLCVVY